MLTAVGASNSVSTQEKFILGDKNEEPWIQNEPQGTAQAFQSTPAQSGVVSSVQIYLDVSTTATNLVAGIYTDNSGYPGTLIAKGNLSTLKLGAWNSVSIPDASVTAGKPYWLAILGTDGQIGFLDQVGSSTGLMARTSHRTVLTDLPATWTASSYGYNTNAAVSIYGNGN